jgi:hypothetical protein
MNYIRPYATRNVLHGLAFLGIYHIAKFHFMPTVCAFWRHFLQPRARGLKDRYGAAGGKPWALVTGASDGIGE